MCDSSSPCKVVWTHDMSVKEKADKYWHAGCHPEIVEYVWDTLNSVLPISCSCTINGQPVLLHPKSNTIMAICMGTNFLIRVTNEDLQVAASEKYETTSDWNGPKDLKTDFGINWFFGKFSETSEIFCLDTFLHYN